MVERGGEKESGGEVERAGREGGRETRGGRGGGEGGGGGGGGGGALSLGYIPVVLLPNPRIMMSWFCSWHLFQAAQIILFASPFCILLPAYCSLHSHTRSPECWWKARLMPLSFGWVMMEV